MTQNIELYKILLDKLIEKEKSLDNITPCGLGKSLIDGLSIYKPINKALLYYNIGKDTKAVSITI